MRSVKEHKPQQSRVIQNIQSFLFPQVIQMVKESELAKPIKKGSPATHIIGNTYIKKWARDSEKSAKEMYKNWYTVDCAGINVPQYGVKKFEDTPAYYFYSKKCKGDEFFQMSKPGHDYKLKDWLSCGHGIWYLRRLSIMFRKFTFGDPQGFYKSVPNGILEFIDINKNNNSLVMSNIANYIDTQLLKSTQKANL